MRNAPSAAHLAVFLILCSSVSNTRGELRALEVGPCQLKKPFKAPYGDKGVAGWNIGEQVFLDDGIFFEEGFSHIWPSLEKI